MIKERKNERKASFGKGQDTVILVDVRRGDSRMTLLQELSSKISSRSKYILLRIAMRETIYYLSGSGLQK